MTRGFYEQIAVRPDADLDEIKAAYARAVAHLLRRREATLAQGGDTSALDLARAQLDEAWAVLSDAARRRRYDAMLAVAGDGLAPGDREDLWSRVAGAMIHPAVAAAARIVDVATTLHLGPLAEPPRPTDARLSPADVADEHATATPRTLAGFGAPRPVARSAAIPSDPGTTPSQAGEVRRTSPRIDVGFASGELPPPSAPPPPLVVAVPTTPAQELEQLVDRLGYSGALLRAARERLGITLQQISETTRISASYLEAVEREDFGVLPSATAFVRGYVREMARILGLDVDRVVAGYMRRFDSEI